MYEVLNVYLENGLRVILHKIPHMKTISCGIWIKQGSKHESDETNGLSHLLEHLMINPENSSNPQFQRLIKEVSSEGIVYNAGTTKECTSFYMSGLSKNLGQCLDTLAAMVIHNKTFPIDMFENEKKVVIQEAISAFSSLNQIKERSSQALWGNMDIGRIILGSIDNVKNANIENMEKLIHESYTPENASLIVLGGIDYEKTLDMIIDKFSLWEDRETREYKEIVESEPGIYFNSIKNGENSAIAIGFRIPGYVDNERINIEIMSQILGQSGIQSRLVQKIRVKRGLAYNLGSFINSYEKRGTLGFASVCSHESVEEIIKIMINEFKEIKECGFTEDEVDRAKKVLETRTLFDLDNSVSHLKFLGRCSSYGQMFSLEQEIRNIQKINKEQVDRVAKSILVEENIGLAAIGNFDIDKSISLLTLT